MGVSKGKTNRSLSHGMPHGEDADVPQHHVCSGPGFVEVLPCAAAVQSWPVSRHMDCPSSLLTTEPAKQTSRQERREKAEKSGSLLSPAQRVVEHRVVKSGSGGGGGGVWTPVSHSVGLLLLYGALDSHPFVPPHVASGRCVLSAAAAGAPAGVVSAFAEPSGWCAGAVLDVAGCAVCASAAPNSWRIGGCAGCCGGRLTGFAAHAPPPPPPKGTLTC